MAFWHRLTHRESEGNLPLVEQQNAAFLFQANAGHNYDQWPWVYPAQTNQYTYFNAFTGNQLPNFSVYVPRYASAQQAAQINRPWFTSTNKQQQNAFQAQFSGVGPLQWGQQQSADYIASIGQQWARGGRGNRRRMMGPRRAGRGGVGLAGIYEA